MDLKKVKEKLERLKNGGNTNAGWWKIKDGEHIVRIAPNPKYDDSLLEFHMHYGVGGGKDGSFLCPKKNFKEKCPVCDFASELWNEGGDSINLAKKLFAKQRFFSPVVVRGEEKEGIRWWSYSKTVYESILKLMDNPDYGDITDPDNGTDLIVNYGTPKGKLYPDTTIQPRRKSSLFCVDVTGEECQEMIENMPDIKNLLSRKTSDEVKAILDQFLLSSSDKDAEGGSKETEKYGKEEAKKEEEKSSIDKAFEELDA